LTGAVSRRAAELRVPTFRGGTGGKFLSAVGLGIEVRGSRALGAATGGTGEGCALRALLGPLSTIDCDVKVFDAPVSCAASRLRKGFFELICTGALDPVVCGAIDPSIRDIQPTCTRIENMLAPAAKARARVDEGESNVRVR